MSSTNLSKTDSEVSSLTPSSPPNSSPARGGRPAYFVQSPSRDSHDATTTNSSHHSTPAALSPAGSPPRSHSNSSLGPHSNRSSSTRFSGSLKHTKHGRRGSRRGVPWKEEFDVIEEEGLLDGDDREEGIIPRRCYFPAFVAGFFMLFSFFALILWGASRPQKPRITMKTIKFDQFVVQAGSDHSGVATGMVTMNSTVRLTFRNTGTFFGVHVASSPLDLSYSQLTLATGTVNEFYQSRKSQRSIAVILEGSNIPVYGGGSDLSSVNGVPTQPVPLRLTFHVRSRAYVLGKLVQPRFGKRIICSVVMDPKKMAHGLPLKDKCTFQ
ncbi:uncharacterized protein LOC116199271 [Punica granatum]|uniref:Late embryogenesis abundant protein LEA-2 subgroup domain-containing protein n=2 Tax=Punica granatum TaxID=22663 RepID=A0A218W1C3_PUNGR|nr:uncharacterized protein LOC116199271 [Punica granatum]OWM66268.1 hypothetical protein CDL15_Pgr013485 [Punica granatum]PKI50159.1 hypothetical protein CRG98_029483 [Punica granatum]